MLLEYDSKCILGGVTMTTQTIRLSVTVKPELKAIADEVAKENKTSRSKVISQCLEELAQKRTIKLMEEGYREMAEENRLLAEQFLPIALEVWPRQSADS